MIAELPRLKAAFRALSEEHAAPAARHRSTASTPSNDGRGKRRPRGPNRDAILAVIRERPGVSVGEVAAAVEKQGVKKNVTYTTVNKLGRDGTITKADGALTLSRTGGTP